MSLRQRYSFSLLFLVMVMISISLACNLPQYINRQNQEAVDKEIDWLVNKGSGELSESEKAQFFESVEGERSYSVVQDDQYTGRGCNPGYPEGDDVQMSIYHDPETHYLEGEGSVDDPASVIVYLDDGSKRTYIRDFDNDFIFCRSSMGFEIQTKECLEFKTSYKFELSMYEANDEGEFRKCYSADYTFDSDAAVGDLGDKAPVESCIIKQDDGFYWENSVPEIIEGDGVTVCKWTFSVLNNSNQDQRIIIHISAYTGSSGMKHEGWTNHQLLVNEPYEDRYVFSDYYGRGGDVTWRYSTKMLVIHDKPMCWWMTEPTPENQELLEKHSFQLENPCIE